MGGMFYNAKAFTNQDLSSWKVNNVPQDQHNGFMKDSGDGNIEPTW